jgi:hypothetical protein
MRAYTSLFGHIVGSNPAICGYYEMHIGYYSWKSLLRQKLLYFENEEIKPGFSFMFDKILHNDHEISLSVLNGRQARTIFSLRQPERTIPSILKLYQSIDPSHEFNGEAFATDYYIERLNTLEKIATSLGQGFFYLDAEVLQTQAQDSLDTLSDWLQLDIPLSSNYSIQKKTAQERYGDSSPRITQGKIVDQKPGYAEFQHDQELLARATATYDRVRDVLISSSARHCVTHGTTL